MHRWTPGGHTQNCRVSTTAELKHKNTQTDSHRRVFTLVHSHNSTPTVLEMFDILIIVLRDLYTSFDCGMTQCSVLYHSSQDPRDQTFNNDRWTVSMSTTTTWFRLKLSWTTWKWLWSWIWLLQGTSCEFLRQLPAVFSDVLSGTVCTSWCCNVCLGSSWTDIYILTYSSR